MFNKNFQWVMSCKCCRGVLGTWEISHPTYRIYFKNWSKYDRDSMIILSGFLITIPFFIFLFIFYSEPGMRKNKYEDLPCPFCGIGGQWYEKTSARWIPRTVTQKGYWQLSEDFRRLPGQAGPGALSLTDKTLENKMS